MLQYKRGKNPTEHRPPEWLKKGKPLGRCPFIGRAAVGDKVIGGCAFVGSPLGLRFTPQETQGPEGKQPGHQGDFNGRGPAVVQALEASAVMRTGPKAPLGGP